MGAAGLTSSSVEMASKGGAGIRLDMNKVPCRETGMTPYEMMLSESQERMLMVLKPGREGESEAIFRKWELDFAVIGRITDTGRLVLTWHGEVVADLPLAPIGEEAPRYARPMAATPPPPPLADVPASADVAADLLALMGTPALGSRRWIWEQYDHMVMADTVQRPGGDAAVVRVHGTRKALAITTDCTPRYCLADPVEGGRQAIAEAWRNLVAAGARPLAATDCMNFGNPENPVVMGQFAACIDGMAEACRALDLPIVSGNVSLYNDTEGTPIPPTPSIGAVGLIEDWALTMTPALKAPGEALLLLGEARGHLGQSLWLRLLHGRADGPPPPVDLAAERRSGELVADLIRHRLVSAVHDVSDGGALVTVAEMALAGGIGATLGPMDAAAAFGEDQGCFVVATPDPEAVLAAAAAADVPARRLGTSGGAALVVEGCAPLPLAVLRDAHERALPAMMAGELIA
jgi:phosphoribosylformylglycinamidine synthase